MRRFISILLLALLLSGCSIIEIEPRENKLPSINIKTWSDNCRVKPRDVDEVVIKCKWKV